MSRSLAAALCLALAGCATSEPPSGGSSSIPPPAGGAPFRDAAPPGPRRGFADFQRVAARIEPVARQFCRQAQAGAAPISCDFAIGLSRDPAMPPNAFQTRDAAGRPIIILGAALLDEMTNDDEIAFVLSHEASHQIADHLGRQERRSAMGALILGGIIAAAGEYGGIEASDDQIAQAMDVGAFLGGRAYSQDYELEADRLGVFIAARAGYDPERGAMIFERPVMAGGGGLLSTHPASEDRVRAIAATAAEIRRRRAAGLEPAPG